MIPTSDFGALRAFMAVAEVLSFNRAADLLGVSSSALSQTIRSLEQRVGARLLNRTTRSVSLTEAGIGFLERTRPAMNALGEAFEQVRLSGERVAGVVRIHTFRIAADIFLAPMLARFHEAYPEVVLDVTLDDEVVDIVAERFDAAIRLGELIEKDMVAVPLGSEIRQVTVASPEYLAAHGTPATPQDLLRHRCIRWRWPGHSKPYLWEFCEAGRWFSVGVDGPLIANSRAFGVHAAVEGIGIAFAAEEAVAAFIEDGRLVPLLEDWSAPFQGFYLCYPRQRQMAPALRAFIDALRTSTNKRPSSTSLSQASPICRDESN